MHRSREEFGARARRTAAGAAALLTFKFTNMKTNPETSAMETEASHARTIKIIGARYDVSTGVVTFYE